MSLQWEFLVGFLYFEVILVIVLLIPFVSPQYWQKVFKSSIVRKFESGAKYYFNFIIFIFFILFLDSIRQFRAHQGKNEPADSLHPHSSDHQRMLTFRAQRNFYIAGFALFLWFVIKRLVSLLITCAHHMAQSTASQQQAKAASKFAETLVSDQTKNSSRESTPANSSDELISTKKELEKVREEFDDFRQRYEFALRDLSALTNENKNLNKKLAALGAVESSKDK